MESKVMEIIRKFTGGGGENHLGSRRGKAFLSVLLSIVMVIGMLPVTAFEVRAGQTPVSYLKPTYTSSGITGWTTENCTSYTDASSSTSWGTAGAESWYVADGGTQTSPITLSDVTVTGNVNLILKNGCYLKVTGSKEKAGIAVSGGGNSLTIYAQSTEITMGALNATGGSGGAGIGGGNNGNGSDITINGGKVTAQGKGFGAGIGGGKKGDGSNITINGGEVEATGKAGGAGIGGGGLGETGSNITINGGKVTAKGSTNGSSDVGAGIGGGSKGNGSYITINGGDVTATGGATGFAGIGGGGNGGSGSNITAADDVVIKADNTNPPTTVIGHTSLASDLAGKQYATAVEECTVTYNGNGETGGTAPADAKKYTYNASVTVLGNTGSLVKTGYTFAGWNTKTDGTGTDRAVGSTFDITANTTLYAKWTEDKYTVTYDGNRATGGTVPSDTTQYTYNASVTVKGNTGSLAKTGYTFAGWNTKADGTGTDRAAGSTFDIKENTTLYAQWKEKKADEYTITFDANGGSGSMAAQPTSNKKLTLPGCGFTAPEGKEFEGWGVGSAEAETKAAGTEVTFTEDKTVYAKWKDKTGTEFTVTFDMNGHGVQEASQSVAEDTRVTKPDDPVEEGWVFLGWYKEGLEKAWDFLCDLVTKTTTLFAKWEKGDYAVRFNEKVKIKGSDTGSYSYYVEDNEDITLPKPSGEKGSKTFLGWKDSSEESDSLYEAETTYTVKGNVSFYAVYGRKKTIDGKTVYIGNEPTQVNTDDVEIEGDDDEAAGLIVDEIKNGRFPAQQEMDIASHISEKYLKEYLSEDEDEDEYLSAAVKAHKATPSTAYKEEEGVKELLFTTRATLKKVKVTKDDNGNEDTELTYTVEPYVREMKDGEPVSEEQKIENKAIKSAISFCLSLPTNAKKYVKVDHMQDDGTAVKDTSYYDIQEGTNSDGVKEKYVNVKSGSFSDFVITFTDKKPDTPDPKPSSGGGNDSTAATKPEKTGNWDDPVKNGTWSQGTDGRWSYKTNAVFINTWGYIQYTDRNGIVRTGWFWFDANGKMATGWKQVNGSWFYFDETDGGTLGMMLQGWITWSGNQYYLVETRDSNGGKMLANTTTPDGHVVDETGKRIK